MKQLVYTQIIEIHRNRDGCTDEKQAECWESGMETRHGNTAVREMDVDSFRRMKIKHRDYIWSEQPAWAGDL